MEFVYYSVVSNSERYPRQWCHSIRSLRKYNANIPVYLFVYDTPPASMLEEARRSRVIVHHAGTYYDCQQRIFPERAEPLSRYPMMHKFLSLAHCSSTCEYRALYLDCDTFFFGDVATLFRSHCDKYFYAREEPWSARSRYGYDPSYLNEQQLLKIAHSQGLVFVPPYNAGVCLLNHDLGQQLVSLSKELLQNCWRLLLGIYSNSALAEACNPMLRDAVQQSLTKQADDDGLEYPSRNWWILDEIALVLTLGAIPGLSHETLSADQVLQNGEFEGGVTDKTILLHYYSNSETRFFSTLPSPTSTLQNFS